MVGFALAAVAFYPEIATPNRILADYDVWVFFYPLRAYAVAALQAGRFPLWNPDTFLGAPFFANPQTALLYPGSLLFLLFPVPYAYSLSVLLHVWLAAVFTYLFLRNSFGVGRVAAALGASAFAFGGAVSAQVGHINQLSATPWIPLIVLAADRAYGDGGSGDRVARRRLLWGVVGAVGLGFQLVAGHMQVTYMTAWVVAVLLACRALADWRRDRHWLHPLARAALVGTMIGLPGGLLAAAQLIPTAELSAESIRGGGMSYADAVAFSLPPSLLIRSLLPGYWANVPSTEFLGYVGAIPLFFALLGLGLSRRRGVVFAALIAGMGVVLSLGGANPAYGGLLKIVPGLDLFRVPARWLLVYSFGAASLAALGIDWALHRPLLRSSWWRAVAVPGGLSLVLLVTVPLAGGVPGRIVLLWLLGFAAAAVLAVLRLRWPGRVTAAALILLTLGELRLAATNLAPRNAVPADAYFAAEDVPRHLAASPGGRILSTAPTEYEVANAGEIAARYADLSPDALFLYKTAIKLDDVMSPNVPLRFGLATIDGYDGGVLPLRRYLDLASLLIPREQIRPDGVLRTRLSTVPAVDLLDLFGVRAVISAQTTDVPGLRRTDFPFLHVYDRTYEGPPPGLNVSLVPQAEVASDSAALESLRASPQSRTTTVRLADGPTGGPPAGSGTARFQRMPGSPERIAFQRISGDGSGYLLIDDAWMAGWRAWVDGVESPVYRANVLFKAVWVPANGQSVVLSYEPNSVKLGAVGSTIGLILVGSFLVLVVAGRGSRLFGL